MINQEAENVTARMYEILFSKYPETKPLFVEVMFDLPLMVYRISHIFLPSGLIQSCNPFPSDNEYFFSVGLEFFTSKAVRRNPL